MCQVRRMAKLPNNPPGAITAKYTIANNTLVKGQRATVEERLEIEVGDITDRNNFRPHFKIKKWDDEVNFALALNIPGNQAEQVSYEGVETITWQKNGYRAIFYDHPEASGEGGFEFEILIPSRPPVDSITVAITHKGLKFIKQPALPQELLDRGWIQPENAVNSYAVYHESKRDYRLGEKNYRTGKAFHIFRPKVTDSLGNWIWADIDIDPLANTLTLSVDGAWLDAAAYPIVIDPTFGYETAGAFGANVENIYITGGGTPTGSGTVSKLTAYVEATSANKNFKGGIHNNSLTKLTNGETGATLVSTVGWYDLTFATPPSVTASSFYYLGVVCESLGGTGLIYVDNAGDYGYGETASTYPTVPTTINDFSIFFFVSVYATYGAGGGRTTKNTDARPLGVHAGISRRVNLP